MQPQTDALEAAGAAGLWRNNIALVQLLGLCPLLAVTTSAVNGLALGLASMAVLILTSTTVSVLRGLLLPAARIPVFVLIVAVLVTCIDLLAHAALDELHEGLGIFILLIVTNCGIVAHAETVAARRPVVHSMLSAASTGFGFLGVLFVLGATRELLGHGTVFAGLPMLWGSAASPGLQLPFGGMLVAVLPPGAFFGLALLLALRNKLSARPDENADTAESAAP